MAATALRKSHFGAADVADPALRIGSYGNYRREDFVFPRTQSRTMREAPWAQRLHRQRSWSEIIGVGLAFGFAGLAIVLSTALT